MEEITYERTGETVILRTDNDSEWLESDAIVDLQTWL